jgi:hypothetical protein
LEKGGILARISTNEVFGWLRVRSRVEHHTWQRIAGVLFASWLLGFFSLAPPILCSADGILLLLQLVKLLCRFRSELKMLNIEPLVAWFCV